jgi:hypothetical protein
MHRNGTYTNGEGYFLICGPGSSFGIATDYGLYGPGIGTR